MQHLPQFTWEYSRIWGQTQTYDCTGLEEIVSPLFFRACRCQRLSYPFHFWMKCSRQYKVFYAKPTTALLSSYLKPKWTLSLGTTETWTQPMLKLEEHLRKKLITEKNLSCTEWAYFYFCLDFPLFPWNKPFPDEEQSMNPILPATMPQLMMFEALLENMWWFLQE